MITKRLLGAIVLCSAVAVGQTSQISPNESLLEAARAGDTAGMVAALNRGASVDAKGRYDLTPLYVAATSGRLDAVKLLVARGANVNAEDSFYHARAAEMAMTNGHTAVTIFLLESGAKGDGLLLSAVQSNDEAMVKAALASDLTREGLQSASALAGRLQRTPLSAMIKAALDARPEPRPRLPSTRPLFHATPATTATPRAASR